MRIRRKSRIRRLCGHPVVLGGEDLLGLCPLEPAFVKMRVALVLPLVLPLVKLEEELLSPTAVGEQARQFEAALAMWEAGDRPALINALV